jgi:hypothetical protein
MQASGGNNMGRCDSTHGFQSYQDCEIRRLKLSGVRTTPGLVFYL